MEDKTIHTPVMLSDNKELQTNLEKENITDLVITDLKTKYSDLKVIDLNDVVGYKAVDEARKEVKRIRVVAEKIVKSETDKAYQAHKAAVGDGKKVIARFTELEESLEKKQAVIDSEKARLQKIEDDKKLEITKNRVAELQSFGCILQFEIVGQMTSELYDEKLAEVKLAYETEQKRIAEEKRLAQIEADRIEAQRVEQEKERFRLEKIAADQEAERLKQLAITEAKEKEIADREAKLKADQEAHDKKIADEKASIEKAKFDAEQKVIRDAEIKAAEKVAAEKALKDAEEKRINDAKAEEIRIENLRLENIRLESLKSEKEKLTEWVNGFQIDISGDLAENKTVKEIFSKFESFKNWSKEQINNLK